MYQEMCISYGFEIGKDIKKGEDLKRRVKMASKW